MKSEIDDLIRRLRDIRELLLNKGFNGHSIYGLCEWSAPIVNLDLAIKIAGQIKEKEWKGNG